MNGPAKITARGTHPERRPGDRTFTAADNICLRANGQVSGGPPVKGFDDIKWAGEQRPAGGCWRDGVDEAGKRRLDIILALPPRCARLCVPWSLLQRRQAEIGLGKLSCGCAHLSRLRAGRDYKKPCISYYCVCFTHMPSCFCVEHTRILR